MYSKEQSFTKIVRFDVTIIASVLLLTSVFSYSYYFSPAFGISPAFDESLISDLNVGDQGIDWIQTRGNETDNIMSDYANILAVNYFSNGQTLNTTLWLASNSENASIYDQPFKTIVTGKMDRIKI